MCGETPVLHVLTCRCSIVDLCYAVAARLCYFASLSFLDWQVAQICIFAAEAEAVAVAEAAKAEAKAEAERGLTMHREQKGGEGVVEPQSEEARWPPDAHDTVGCVSVDAHGDLRSFSPFHLRF